MKIKFKSKLFKSSVDNEEYDLNSEFIKFYISNDLNFSKLLKKEEIELAREDYNALINEIKGFESLNISGVPQDIIIEFLRKAPSINKLSIANTELDFSKLSDIDFSTVKELELFSTGNNFSETPSNIASAGQFNKLSEISLINSKNLDMTAFFDSLPNPDKVKKVILSAPLPDPIVFGKFENIEDIDIRDVDDPKQLADFLSGISLKCIKSLSITNCNMIGIKDSVIKDLTNLEELKLSLNQFANYNQILYELPNPDALKKIFFSGKYENPDYVVDTRLFGRFNNLNNISLLKQNIDLDEFQKYLQSAQNLEHVRLVDIDFHNLEFLKNTNPNTMFSLKRRKGIDVRWLTPELARTHRQIFVGDDNYTMNTTLNPESSTYAVTMKIPCNDLYHTRELLQSADTISSLLIEIPNNSNGINQVLAFVPYEKCEKGYELLLDNYSIGTEDVSRLEHLGAVTVADRAGGDLNIPKRFKYSPEVYTKLYKKVQEIVEDIPRDLPEIDKFTIIYRRLGSSIVYDYGIINDNEYSEYAKQNLDNCRNSINGLLGVGEKGEKKCVCAGYSDILYNCLKAVGITAFKITGLSGNDYHQWNKVILDGVCYNTDLTFDADLLRRGVLQAPPNCLVEEEIFSKYHKITTGVTLKAPQSYNRRQLRNSFKKAYEFDKVKPKGTIQKIKESISRIFGKKKKELNSPTISSSSDTPACMPSRKKVPSWELTEEDRKKVNLKINDIGINSDVEILDSNDKDRIE